MQGQRVEYGAPLAPGALVDASAIPCELEVVVVHRVHGSSIWEPIQDGQRIRVAPRVGKNLKVAVSSPIPAFDLSAPPEASQLVLLQNNRYESSNSGFSDAFRVGSSADGARVVEISLSAAPLQALSEQRLEFDAKLFMLHKGYKFFAKVWSPMMGRFLYGAGVEFVAHNSGTSRDTSESKKAKSK